MGPVDRNPIWDVLSLAAPSIHDIYNRQCCPSGIEDRINASTVNETFTNQSPNSLDRTHCSPRNRTSSEHRGSLGLASLTFFILVTLGGANAAVIPHESMQTTPLPTDEATLGVSTSHSSRISDPIDHAWIEGTRLTWALIPLFSLVGAAGGVLWRHSKRSQAYPTWLAYLTIAASLCWFIVRQPTTKDEAAIRAALWLWFSLGLNLLHALGKQAPEPQIFITQASLIGCIATFMAAALQTLGSSATEPQMATCIEHAKDSAPLIFALTAVGMAKITMAPPPLPQTDTGRVA